MSEAEKISDIHRLVKEQSQAITGLNSQYKDLHEALVGTKYNNDGIIQRLDRVEIRQSKYAKTTQIVETREKQFKWAMATFWTAIVSTISLFIKRFFGE